MPSLAIRSFAYDADRNELSVTFVTGKAYVYSLVPADVFRALESARSKGAYFNTHIRDRFSYRKIASPGASVPLLQRLLTDSVDDQAGPDVATPDQSPAPRKSRT